MSRAQDWLAENVGLENFKGGFARASKLISPTAQKIQKNHKVVTIAGTNGKGQVACQLSELLERKDLKVACWTSPHLLNVSERFYFSDINYTDEDLIEVFKQHIDVLKENPSYYEFLFYIFCQLCLENNFDVLILEVGLGGRLDAVNVFDADFTAITSISLDHQEVLGSELTGIFAEKWGIARSGAPMFSVLHQDELQKMAQQMASEQDILWLDLLCADIVDMQQSYWERNSTLACALALVVEGHKVEELPAFREQLRTSPHGSLRSTKGRFEEMTSGGVRFIFVGAHNCDGLQNLVVEIEKRWPQAGIIFDEIWLSFSQRPEDEIKVFFKALGNLNSRTQNWRYCRFEHPKALRWQSIDVTKWRLWSQVLNPPIQELFLDRALREKPKSGTILVTGSYYFIGEVQKFLL
jgi:dihydrofolate synthase/folylpolyglutamate synthase